MKTIFYEYMNLSYCPTSRPNRLKDIKISDYIIARLFPNGCKIIYLFNGSSLFIPWSWLDLFTTFNMHSGDKIYHLSKLNDLENLDNIDKILLLFSKLSYSIDSNLSRINGDEFLEILGEIGTTGTHVFRDWCKDEFKINLDPLEYVSLDKNLEI